MPVITVSRECGSCGEEIARQVAEKLGYGYFDKEILAEVAREAHTTEERISEYDEKDEHGLRAFLKKLFVPSEVPLNYSRFYDELPYYFPPSVPLEWSLESRSAEPVLDADEVTSFFRSVMEKVWKRGNVVIVGRGSQKVLGAKPNALHVRFIGNRVLRSESVKQGEGITYEEALKKIEAIGKQRSHYLKHYYDADWGDPILYHLVINTSLMSDEQAVNVIGAAVHQIKADENR